MVTALEDINGDKLCQSQTFDSWDELGRAPAIFSALRAKCPRLIARTRCLYYIGISRDLEPMRTNTAFFFFM